MTACSVIFSTRRQTSHLGSVLTSQKKSKPKSSHKKIETPDNQNQNRADKYSKLILLDQSGSNFIPISIGLLRPAVLDATFENQASMNSGQNMRRYGRQDSNVEGGRMARFGSYRQSVNLLITENISTTQKLQVTS